MNNNNNHKRVMTPANAKNYIIGLFVLSAVALVIFILLFLHPFTGDKSQILTVRFSDIDKVNVGTRVSFAGKAVGEVKEIYLAERERSGPSDELGHLYMYELKLAIDSRLKVYDTDVIALRTSGLLGERSVAIIPLVPRPGQTPKLLEKGHVIYAQETATVEDTMKDFKEVADRADTVLENLIDILQQVRHEEIVKKIGDTAQNLSDISAALNQPEELTAIVQNLQTFSSELATRLPPSWDMIDKSLTHTKDITEDTRKMIHTMSEGKGTLGKLVVSDDLYIRTVALLNKGEVIMDDMNHYGLLYNLDKGWQRMRARRANLLEQLSTPQEFQNYFNDEVNQISTSLSRVSMVLTKTQDLYPCLLIDTEFSRVFGELLRRVEAMQDALKIYQEQLVDCDRKIACQ